MFEVGDKVRFCGWFPTDIKNRIGEVEMPENRKLGVGVKVKFPEGSFFISDRDLALESKAPQAVTLPYITPAITPIPDVDRRDYDKIGKEIGELVKSKQAAYGDSFGKSGQVMRILYPDGVKPEQMDDALTLVRIIDKCFRIATKKDAFGEDPYRDIAGYSILAVARNTK